MKLIQRFGLMVASVTCLALSASAQTATAPTTTQDVLLAVNGEVVAPLKLTRADLDKFRGRLCARKITTGRNTITKAWPFWTYCKRPGLSLGMRCAAKLWLAIYWSKRPMVTRRFMRCPNSILQQKIV